MRSWIVEFWDRFFALLSWVSPFNLLRRVFRGLQSPGGVEAWVTAHMGLAFVAACLAASLPTAIGVRILVCYGALRVFEVTVYQMNVLLFDQLRAHRAGRGYALEGYTRIVLLLLCNYLEIILWFAAAYGVLFSHLTAVAPLGLDGLLKDSFATFTGFGSAEVDSKYPVAFAVIWAESAAGLFMSIVVLARFIGMLPAPGSKTLAEQRDD